MRTLIRQGRLAAFLIFVPGFVLALASPVAAQFGEDWRRLESPHFRLVGPVDAGTLDRVAGNLEEFRAAFMALLPEYREIYPRDTTVVVFEDDDAFRPFKPLDGPDVSGYFTASPYRSYIALTGAREMEHTIYHEYVHQLTRDAGGWPRWMREGVAEFYSTIEVRSDGEKVLLGRPIADHLRWLRQAFIPLEDFLHPDTSYESLAETTSLYAQGWAFIHFAQFGEPGLAARLETFLGAMSASGNDVEASVRTAFGTGIETLRSELIDYIGSSRFPAGEKTLSEPLEEVDLPESVAIPPFEADFYMGDLLLHLGRVDEAAAFLEASLASGGEFEPALTSLAILELRRGRPGGMRDWLDRAVRAPGAGYLPHLLRAETLLEGGSFDQVGEEAEAHLEFVLSERPGLPEGQFWMGRVLMRKPASIGDAVRVLESAVELGGGDPRMRLDWARALFRSGRDREAAGILEALGAAEIDPALSEQAETLLREIRWLIAAGEAGYAPARAAEPGPETARIPRFIPPEGATRIEGYIVYVGCAGGFQLRVVSGEDRVNLIGPGMETVRLVSYSPQLGGQMMCGVIDPPIPARIAYRPSDGMAGVDGEPVRVDFLP